MKRDTIKQPLVAKINTPTKLRALCVRCENRPGPVCSAISPCTLLTKNIKSADKIISKYSSMFDVYDVKKQKLPCRACGRDRQNRLASTVNKTKVIRKVLWTVRESISITNISCSVCANLQPRRQQWTRFFVSTDDDRALSTTLRNCRKVSGNFVFFGVSVSVCSCASMAHRFRFNSRDWQRARVASLATNVPIEIRLEWSPEEILSSRRRRWYRHRHRRYLQFTYYFLNFSIQNENHYPNFRHNIAFE